MTENSNFDEDDILDSTLDDLEDLPTNEPFPAGAHRALVSMERKEVNKHPTVEVSCKLVETLELANPTEDNAPEPGTQANILCMLDNEFGRGNFKLIASAVSDTVGSRNNREIIEKCKDIECLIVTTIRKDKNDPDVKRMNIKAIDAV